MNSGVVFLKPEKKTQTASGQLQQFQKDRTTSADPASSKKMKTPFAQFTLSWSQYIFLIGIKNIEERRFYEIEATDGGWTLPELKHQFNSGLYERLAIKAVIKMKSVIWLMKGKLSRIQKTL